MAAEDTPSGEWTNYDGRGSAESKHISFKISHLKSDSEEIRNFEYNISQLFLQIYPSVTPSQSSHTRNMRNERNFQLHDHTTKHQENFKLNFKKAHAYEQKSAQVV